jgi:hypothetical protein
MPCNAALFVVTTPCKMSMVAYFADMHVKSRPDPSPCHALLLIRSVQRNQSLVTAHLFGLKAMLLTPTLYRIPQGIRDVIAAAQ